MKAADTRCMARKRKDDSDFLGCGQSFSVKVETYDSGVTVLTNKNTDHTGLPNVLRRKLEEEMDQVEHGRTYTFQPCDQ